MTENPAPLAGRSSPVETYDRRFSDPFTLIDEATTAFFFA
jgi:hypothetical protein